MPPPKKKRKITVPEKPGIARQYLAEHFSNVAEGEVRNGHHNGVLLFKTWDSRKYSVPWLFGSDTAN